MSDKTQWPVTKVLLYWSETHWRGRVERPKSCAMPSLDWALADDGAPFLGDRPTLGEMADALRRIAAKVGVTFKDFEFSPHGNGCVSEGPFTPLAAEPKTQIGTERMLKWFKYDHLQEPLSKVSARFFELAHNICASCEPGPERTVALRKLLEAKDAAVRAKLHPGG
jgi:hypothetical protein